MDRPTSMSSAKPDISLKANKNRKTECGIQHLVCLSWLWRRSHFTTLRKQPYHLHPLRHSFVTADPLASLKLIVWRSQRCSPLYVALFPLLSPATEQNKKPCSITVISSRKKGNSTFLPGSSPRRASSG